MIGEINEIGTTTRFEYHGHTEIEQIVKKEGATVRRDWMVFNSVDEALDYFNAYCISGE